MAILEHEVELRLGMRCGGRWCAAAGGDSEQMRRIKRRGMVTWLEWKLKLGENGKSGLNEERSHTGHPR
jgi:hypothetical protein